jgi:hypothetical protein
VTVGAAYNNDFVGYVTLQLATGRQTQIQTVVGDQSSCTQLSITTDAGTSQPPATASVTLGSCVGVTKN